jgi:nucleoside-diphosphate-sugar epimerase
MEKLKVAIFGSTGHIGKNLINYFLKKNNYEMHLFSRNTKSIQKILEDHETTNVIINNYEEFNSCELDVVINCIGIGNPQKIMNNTEELQTVTKSFDEKILSYLRDSSNSLYINMSSGAVYGENFSEGVNENSKINNVKNNLYNNTKIFIEDKHRELPDKHIVDLRIFNFFSRYINLNYSFFISEIIKSIKNKTEFITNNVNITRDFIHPSDFFNLIEKCIKKNTINDTFDVYSKKPISKFDIIDYFSKELDLKFKIMDKPVEISPTGIKKNYFSSSQKASKIGYEPEFTSLDTIQDEIKFLL